MLAFLMFSNASGSNKSGNLFFGIFLILWSTFWLDEVLLSGEIAKGLLIFSVIRFIQFFTPLFLYLSIIFYTKRYDALKKRWFMHASPPIIFALFLIFRLMHRSDFTDYLLVILFLSNAIIYVSVSLFSLKKYRKESETFSSDIRSIDLRWLEYIIYVLFFTTISIAIYNLTTNSPRIGQTANTLFLAVIFIVAYGAVRQKEIFPAGYTPEEKSGKILTESRTKVVDSVIMEDIKNRLLILMESERPYTDPEINLVKLACMLKIRPHQLSYVINNSFNENFFSFINRYRIKLAKRLLKDEKFGRFSILAVGYESGFNSKSSFNGTFRKITGYTPSEYRKKGSDL